MLSTKSFFEKRFIESDLAFPVLLNLIQMISGRFEETKVLLRSLKTKTVRQRIATFLYEQYIIDKSLCIATGFSRLELSEYLNLPRPSLSRELSCMKKDGIIDYTRDNYTILDLQKLRESL